MWICVLLQFVAHIHNVMVDQSGFSQIMDARMFTRPKQFSGRDEDLDAWATANAYVGAFDPTVSNTIL
eukprot:3958673-Amphidinium_carterae.1